MAPRKLSESDKQDILSQYRQTEDTTATLANQYGVSTSTISRILKQNLPEDEYEALVHQKRSGAFRSPVEQEFIPGMLEVRSTPEPVRSQEPEDFFAAEFPEPEDSSEPEEAIEAKSPEVATAPPFKSSLPAPIRRQRKRSTSPLEEESDSEITLPQFDLASEPSRDAYEPEPNPFAPVQEVVQKAALIANEDFATLAEEEDLDEDLDGEDDDLDDDLDGDLDDDLDDDDLDDEADEGEGDFSPVHIQSRGKLQVLPLSEAPIPKTCYVVVDRASELITRPLRDFADLGQIPTEETQEKTLPIFENHRVAKRFLRRMQRIVKVPDGRIFQKVKPYLQAKGITRLLIDGQVYSL